ncbi:patatin-like phospholipase family protein [Ideonella sp. DXS29W]|uniref:Patatin-like phospholipase family protein n=1 Tax=Ideonella lacteola TaxID=2984193 RepID=A0ABU9BQJ3_9BURK
MKTPPVTGLILTGGGARAAYQVGVLQALAEIRRACVVPDTNPFPVITGTSAGAINAAALAGDADDFDRGVDKLVSIWQGFHADQVYRSDSIGVIRTGARWLTMMSIGWVIARWRRLKPRSLLDNTPLAGLLERMVRLERIPELIRDGHLKALAVSASSYSSGEHVTFYNAAEEVPAWVRSQRRAVRDHIGLPHLLASSAIPFVFPAKQLMIDDEPQWFGDGSMRQAAPISPAIHLGAERILVVGAGRMHEPPGKRHVSAEYPTMAQIAGHALSNIFLDALAVDVERLQRINRTLQLLPAEAREKSALRPIDVLLIAPSQRLDDIAARHLDALPLTIRTLLRGVGVSGQGNDARGAALASYLLFESDYTRELMALGVSDTMARRDEVASFFGWALRGEDGHPGEQAAARRHASAVIDPIMPESVSYFSRGSDAAPLPA